ncbi:hypothetical protein J6590_068679 [Homalodisca vitripennis]|nr:hypothetical protein J6590_068679 [Homalodisca vitripennis]
MRVPVIEMTPLVSSDERPAGRPTHGYSTRATVRGYMRVPVIEMTVGLTNTYCVSNALYSRLSPVMRDLQAVPLTATLQGPL